MRHLKSYKLFESVSEQTVRDILLEITDDKIPGAPTPPGSGYPANLFLWFEIKDTIIRLCEYVYSETDLEPIENKPFQQWYLQQGHFAKSPFRMKNGGTEFGIGWHKAEDFTLGDFISFTGLKLIIKL